MPYGIPCPPRTPEIVSEIERLLSEGHTWKKIADTVGVHTQLLGRWLREDTDFSNLCAQAREFGFDVRAESIIEIAEQESDVQRARLRTDVIRWLSERQAPAKYSERVNLNVTQNLDIAGALTEARARITPLRHPDDAERKQVIEVKAEVMVRHTDNQSVLPIQDGDVAQDSTDDIFS